MEFESRLHQDIREDSCQVDVFDCLLAFHVLGVDLAKQIKERKETQSSSEPNNEAYQGGRTFSNPRGVIVKASSEKAYSIIVLIPKEIDVECSALGIGTRPDFDHDFIVDCRGYGCFA